MDQMKIIYRTVQGLKSVSEEDIGIESNLLPVADFQSLQNLEERLRKFPDFQKQLVSQLYFRYRCINAQLFCFNIYACSCSLMKFT